jgi:hypothetical protein
VDPAFHEIGQSWAHEFEKCSHAKRQPGSTVIKRVYLFFITRRALEHFDQPAGRNIVTNVIVGEPRQADARDCHSSQALSVIRK